MFHRALTVVATLFILAGSVAAAPELPGDAKKLGGDEVKALYHGASADFEEFTQEAPYTGTAFFDLEKKRMWGFYVWGGKDHGIFKGTASVKDDQLCSKTEDDEKICAFVHVAGDKAYEVDEAGKVVSVLTFLPKGKPALPAGAVKATADSFMKLTDQKGTNMVVHDYEMPFIGRLFWDWGKKKLVGELILDEKKLATVHSDLSFDGDKVCSAWKGKDISCYAVRVDGNTFYEVTDSGEVHAVAVID